MADTNIELDGIAPPAKSRSHCPRDDVSVVGVDLIEDARENDMRANTARTTTVAELLTDVRQHRCAVKLAVREHHLPHADVRGAQCSIHARDRRGVLLFYLAWRSAV